MAAARFRVRSPCGGFKTRVLRFKVKNTPLKTKNGKRKFKRMLSFLFVEEGKLFIKKSSFEEFNLLGLPRCKNLWYFFFVSHLLFFLGSIVLTSLFSLFYVTREFNRFLHRGWANLFSSRRSTWSVKCNQGSEVFAEFSGTFCTLWPRQLRF